MAARTVIVEKAVEEFLNREEFRYPRLREVYRGLEWRIARQPEAGYRLPHTNPPRYLVKSAYRFPIPCDLVLLYQFTAHEVIIELANIEE